MLYMYIHTRARKKSLKKSIHYCIKNTSFYKYIIYFSYVRDNAKSEKILRTKVKIIYY